MVELFKPAVSLSTEPILCKGVSMDQVIIVLYLGAILAVGIIAGRGVSNISQFSVAGRGFGKWVIFATLSASFIGGGFSMGNAEKVFRLGLVNIFALWGFSLKEILVARFIAPRIKRYPDAITVGDIMGSHYGKAGKIITGILSVIVCGGILGAQVGAIGYIFNVFLGLPQIYGILIGCGIVIIYSTVGGMKSVVLTDIIQFAVLSVGIPLTLVLGIVYAGGWSAMTSAAPASHLTFLGSETSLLQFIALFLAFVVGETLVPPYVQRLFLSKDARHTAQGTLWSGLFSIPFFVVTGLIGFVALSIDPQLDPNLSMPFVIKTVLPVGIKGIVVAGVISVVMSSADSFLNAASVALVHDVVQPLRNQDTSTEGGLLGVRLANALTGILAIVFATQIKSILDILLYSYNFWSPIVLVPLAAGIMGVQATRKHFFAGAIAGIVGVLAWNFVFRNPGGIDGLVVGLLANALVFFGWIGTAHLLEPQAEKALQPEAPRAE